MPASFGAPQNSDGVTSLHIKYVGPDVSHLLEAPSGFKSIHAICLVVLFQKYGTTAGLNDIVFAVFD